MSAYPCTSSPVGGLCNFNGTGLNTGSVLNWNGTCGICCPIGYRIPLNFELLRDCDSPVFAEVFLAASVILYLVGFLFAFTVFWQMVSIDTPKTLLSSIAMLTTIFGIADAAVAFSLGRHTPASRGVFWTFFFLVTLLIFYGNTKVISDEPTGDVFKYQKIANRNELKERKNREKKKTENNGGDDGDVCLGGRWTMALYFLVLAIGETVVTGLLTANSRSSVVYLVVFSVTLGNYLLTFLYRVSGWVNSILMLVVLVLGVTLTGIYVDTHQYQAKGMHLGPEIVLMFFVAWFVAFVTAGLWNLFPDVGKREGGS